MSTTKQNQHPDDDARTTRAKGGQGSSGAATRSGEHGPGDRRHNDNLGTEARSAAQPKGPGSHNISDEARARMAEGGRKGGQNSHGSARA